MLGLISKPTLTLDVLEQGQRIAAATDLLSDNSSLFLISLTGEPETVGLAAARQEHSHNNGFAPDQS